MTVFFRHLRCELPSPLQTPKTVSLPCTRFKRPVLNSSVCDWEVGVVTGDLPGVEGDITTNVDKEEEEKEGGQDDVAAFF